jgi:tetratricopeptide (TPR) repeat protein
MLRSFGNGIWKRPKTTALVLTLLALVGAGVGFYAYALQQWDAAQTALRDDRPAEAGRALGLCLWVWPYSVPVHLLAARRDRLTGDFAGAEAQLQQCIRLHKGASEEVQIEFLLMRVQTGEVDNVAEELFQRVENKSPESSLILETIARAYMDKFRYGPALGCLNRWVEVKPEEAKAYYWRGWVFEHLEEADLAIKDYQRALELSPDLATARFRLAEIMLDKSDPPAALAYLEPLMKQSPERPDVMAFVGRCRYMQGETDEARRLMETAVKKRPDDGPLLVVLAKLELSEDKPIEAERWSRQALKADATNAEAEGTLEKSLRVQGRSKEADAALEQHEKDMALLRKVNRMLGENADPNHPTRGAGDFYEAGALFLRTHQDRQAEYWLNRALELDPEHQPTLKALAEYYEGKGDKEKAAAYRRRLAEAGGKTAVP